MILHSPVPWSAHYDYPDSECPGVLDANGQQVLVDGVMSERDVLHVINCVNLCKSVDFYTTQHSYVLHERQVEDNQEIRRSQERLDEQCRELKFLQKEHHKEVENLVTDLRKSKSEVEELRQALDRSTALLRDRDRMGWPD
jgi:t-SNARE complex subunit (syntaxin)